MLDLSAAVTEQQRDAARTADLDQRDASHGGMRSIPDLVAEQQRKEALRNWRAYRPSVTRAEVAAAKLGAEIDFQRIDARRLLTDCRAAVKRFTRLHRFGGVKRAETVADVLATDAAMILIDRPTSGGGIDPKTGKRSALLDLGGSGGLPLRRDWLDRIPDAPVGAPRWKLSDLAWSALLSAVKEAARAPEIRAAAEQEAAEQPTEALDLSVLIEQQQREAGATVRLPDNQAPETIAAAMDIPLDAARAIVHRAYPHASPADLADSWGLTPGAVKVALSRGARIVRDRFPNPIDLLEALDLAAALWREQIGTDAALALLDYREQRVRSRIALAQWRADQQPTPARRALAWIDLGAELADLAPVARRAKLAAADWRACYGVPSMDRRALDLAARRAYRGSFSAERVSQSVSRILRAEQRRAQSSASAARSSHLGGASLEMAEHQRSSAPVSAEQRSSRVWTYGLTARDDRATRLPASDQSSVEKRSVSRARRR